MAEQHQLDHVVLTTWNSETVTFFVSLVLKQLSLCSLKHYFTEELGT